MGCEPCQPWINHQMYTNCRTRYRSTKSGKPLSTNREQLNPQLFNNHSSLVHHIPLSVTPLWKAPVPPHTTVHPPPAIIVPSTPTTHTLPLPSLFCLRVHPILSNGGWWRQRWLLVRPSSAPGAGVTVGRGALQCGAVGVEFLLLSSWPATIGLELLVLEARDEPLILVTELPAHQRGLPHHHHVLTTHYTSSQVRQHIIHPVRSDNTLYIQSGQTTHYTSSQVRQHIIHPVRSVNTLYIQSGQTTHHTSSQAFSQALGNWIFNILFTISFI